ncbi:stress-response A/B barrel domain-containing protein UP3-like [Impatiens glandulifera]|uniref:stress-response A/B barrel domain-containing protein UP3-like n=1 Tax=Impatiens glandulifera TaxID=253017 RepID=UPI001FB0D552|nr:stress-response A/B barrel domain-containing protein UP3-like [Impatiens glandulifera]
MSGEQIIEHMVLFNIKVDADDSKIDTMIERLNGLISLDSVLHISATLLLPTRISSFVHFTHILHSRHSSKENLAVFTDHPSHVSVMTESVNPICEDIMVVDWDVFDGLNQPIKLQPGSAIKVAFMKLKEGSTAGKKKEEILGKLGGFKEIISSIDQTTCGEILSPARARGYSIAMILVFPGLSKLESSFSDMMRENAHKVAVTTPTVRDLLDDYLTVEFVVPRRALANN